MDSIKDIAKKIMDIIKDDDKFEEKFNKNPAKAIEELFGIDLPDEKVNSVVQTVKTKLNFDKFDDVLEEKKNAVLDKIDKLLD